MKAIILGFFLLALVFSENTCTGNTVYMKLLKQSASYASEESFNIYDGQTLLQSSPTLVNNELRVLEYCLPASTNNQYTLEMKDSYGDSWSNGSWISIEGKAGNTVFKNLMTHGSLESYTISLYYGVEEQSSWKMLTSSVTGTWTEYSFNDSTWDTVTLGSVAATTGPFYFRKTFAGLANMASYELALNYRYGIAAYINGQEIFRDNMPEGAITPTTSATGSYATTSYHAIMRPGIEVSNTQSVLAVEIHFNDAESHAVDFDAYLSLLAPSTSDDSCFIYPYNVTMSTDTGTNVANMFDFKKSTSYNAGSNLPVFVSMTFDGAMPYVNGVRVFPYSSVNNAINSYILQGSHGASEPYVDVVTASNIVHAASTYHVTNGFFNAGFYESYRLQVNGSVSGIVYAYEVQPIICSIAVPTSIVYEPNTFSYYANYETVLIQSKITEFTNCQINPALPNGLSLDPTSCIVSGVATVGSPATVYTVTSTMGTQTYTGSFTLTINACTGTLAQVLRTYKSKAYQEGFEIKDAVSQSTILSVLPDSGQISSMDWTAYVCLTSSKYTIYTSSTVSYWMSSSHLYVNAVLSGDAFETIIRAKFDTNLGLPTEYTFNAQYLVKPNETWNYKMSEVPANWYNSDTSNWNSGSAGSFNPSSNQIQLYKRTFTVSDLQNTAGVVISLKYQAGVIIYLNNHEVFRRGVTGTLSTSSYGESPLNDVQFRQISLPIKTIAVEGSPSVDYITTGSNTIAIALVAASPAVTASTFDCAVRLMGDYSVSRVFGYTSAHSGLGGNPSTFFDHYYYHYIYHNQCVNNYYDIIFTNDRHEWISSVIVKLQYNQADSQPRNFIIKAKNQEDNDWTTLKTVTNMSWSLVGQKNRVWLDNNKAYTQYRIENFATGDPTQCFWQVGMIDYRSDATTVTVPALTYETTSIYKDIEMAEVYPSSDLYKDFSISPALPTGIMLDAYTGIISGTVHTTAPQTTYTISAKQFTGQAATATFTLTIEVCSGGKSLVTLVMITDYYPEEQSYVVYQGKGTSGTPVKSGGNFLSTWSYVFGDFCLNHGMYTLEFKDTYDGWEDPSGYFLYIDNLELKFDTGYVYNNGAHPVSVTTLFSTYLPFQVEYDDWKVYKATEAVASNWNTVEFNDSTWSTMKAAEIGTTEAITVYIRKEVTLDDVNNYHVLNIRAKFSGGMVAYFNGRKVGRFNIIEDFNASTESIAVHDINTFTQFHVILSTVGAVTGKNIMAFEVHRTIGASSAEPVVFDASGVFGVNDCNVVVDTVLDLTGSYSDDVESLYDFFDINPASYGAQPNMDGTFMQWSVENLEGSKFNSFAMQTIIARTGWGFSIYGRKGEEETLTLFEDVNLSTVLKGRSAWNVDVGIAGFRHLRWEVDSPADGVVSYSSMFLQYCKASGAGSCPGVGDYPPVGEGQISPSECEYGLRGYSYRLCTGGVLGEIQTDKCVYKEPSNMAYETQLITFVMDVPANIPAPTYNNIITEFKMDVALPAGLTLDSKTGAITGIPTQESGIQTFTIYGENPSGATQASISIIIRKGECRADGLWNKTPVGETAVHECSMEGSYIGTQTRKCKLGEKDGEWEKIEGVCMPMGVILALSIVGLIVLIVLIYVIMRTTAKRKTVGGVKGKKSKSSVKMDKKRVSAKEVKV